MKQWRQVCGQVNDRDRNQSRRLQDERTTEQEQIKQLERALDRKEQVLSDTEALFALRLPIFQNTTPKHTLRVDEHWNPNWGSISPTLTPCIADPVE
jgi:hypothetical protein